MEEKLIARPTFNRKSGKWNISVKVDGEELKLGHKEDDSIIFKYLEFDTKKDAIEHIEKDARLTLKNEMKEILNKYGRRK